MDSDIERVLNRLDTLGTDSLLEDMPPLHIPKKTVDRIVGRVYAGINMKRKKPRLLWLAPAAAIVAAAIAVASVPEARAAVAGFFKSVFDITGYMSEERGSRPPIKEIESLIQTPSPAHPEESEPKTEFFNLIEDAGFLKGLKFHMDETLYDGENIYINATVSGETSKLGFGESYDDMRVQLDGSAYISVTGADGKSRYFTCSVDARPDGGGTRILIGGSMQHDGFKVMDESAVFTGMQDVWMYFTFTQLASPPQTDKWGGVTAQYKPAGACTMEYRFDATAGASKIRTASPGRIIPLKGSATITEFRDSIKYITAKNTVMPLDGCLLKLDTVNVKPTGISMRILYRCPDSWSETQKEGINGGIDYGIRFRILVNGEDTGVRETEDGKFGDGWRYEDFVIPLVGDQQRLMKKLEVLPVVRYITRINDATLTSSFQDIPIDYTEDGSGAGSGGYSSVADFKELTGSRFSVELP
jgi:hypothetical protein